MILFMSRTILPRIFKLLFFLFDWVLGAMTFQPPFEFQPIVSYPKPHGLTWD